MPNMPRYAVQHRPQRASLYGAIEGGVPHPRANAQYAIFENSPALVDTFAKNLSH